MPTKESRPFRNALFLLTTRAHLANRLVQEMGYSRGEAREAARELADDVIVETAARVAPLAKVGAGGILQFLLDFLQSDTFKQLLDLLLSFFGGNLSAAVQAYAAANPPAVAASTGEAS